MAVPTPLFTTIPWLQLVFAITLIFVSGIAWTFNLWLLPIIKLNTSTSAIAQFSEVSRRGARWLDPLNAAIAVCLMIIAVLQSQHPEPVEAAQWKSFAGASCTLFQVAWWERVMIFWLDDAAVALKDDRGNFKGGEGVWLREVAQVEFRSIVDLWGRRHAVRATLPLLAALILLAPRVL